VFDGLDGAVQAYDYLTFGLVDSVEGMYLSSLARHDVDADCASRAVDCKAMCEGVDGCNFINSKCALVPL